jgi:serine/threonine-protein kinase
MPDEVISTEPTPEMSPTRDALHNLCLADPVWSERYDGWQELGHGGSASVVCTRSRATGEEIALKVFARLSADEWKRYHDEVRNAQRLSSPHIVRTYSAFPRRTFAWIEMEWVDGPNLRQVLDRDTPPPLPFDRAAAIAASVAHGLAIAHAEGIVHRDVKPANILLPRAGRPAAKLGDFGLSRMTDAARLTHTGLLVGTPQFASPEVIEGGDALPASDVYALCLCLYLMLSGNRAPFEISDAGSPTQWLRAHVDQTARPLREHNPEVPTRLADLVDRGLAKQPGDRPTAADLRAAMEAAPPTDPPTLVAPLGARALRPRVFAVGVAGATLGAATVWTLLARPPAPESGREPSLRSETPVAIASAPTRETAARAAVLPTIAAEPTAEALEMRAELRNGVLVVRSSGQERLTDLTITVVAGHVRHHVTVPEPLEPGEDLYLAPTAFTPPLPADVGAVSVVIEALNARRTRRQTKIDVG